MLSIGEDRVPNFIAACYVRGVTAPQEDQALRTLRALGKNLSATVDRARRARSRLGDMGIRVMDELVSQLSRRPIRTRPSDLLKRAAQLAASIQTSQRTMRETEPAAYPAPQTGAQERAAEAEAAPPADGGRRSAPSSAPSHAEAAGDAEPPEAAKRGGSSKPGRATESTTAAPPSPTLAPTADEPARSAPDPSEPAAHSEPSLPLEGPQAGADEPARSAPDPCEPAAHSEPLLPLEGPQAGADEPARSALDPSEPAAHSEPLLPLEGPQAGADGLLLLPRDRTWAYVSWSIPLHAVGAAAAGMRSAIARLRVWSLCDSMPAIDDAVAPSEGEYFFRWPGPGRFYAQLVVVADEGERELARSGIVEAPGPAGPSTADGPRFEPPARAASWLQAGSLWDAHDPDRASSTDSGWRGPAPDLRRPRPDAPSMAYGPEDPVGAPSGAVGARLEAPGAAGAGPGPILPQGGLSAWGPDSVGRVPTSAWGLRGRAWEVSELPTSARELPGRAWEASELPTSARGLPGRAWEVSGLPTSARGLRGRTWEVSGLPTSARDLPGRALERPTSFRSFDGRRAWLGHPAAGPTDPGESARPGSEPAERTPVSGSLETSGGSEPAGWAAAPAAGPSPVFPDRQPLSRGPDAGAAGRVPGPIWPSQFAGGPVERPGASEPPDAAKEDRSGAAHRARLEAWSAPVRQGPQALHRGPGPGPAPDPRRSGRTERPSSALVPAHEFGPHDDG
jgi:hypothetical protein